MRYIFDIGTLMNPAYRQFMAYTDEPTPKLEYLAETRNAKGTLAGKEWRIRKFIYDDDDMLTDVVFANGSNEFIHVVDDGVTDYESYTYTTT